MFLPHPGWPEKGLAIFEVNLEEPTLSLFYNCCGTPLILFKIVQLRVELVMIMNWEHIYEN